MWANRNRAFCHAPYGHHCYFIKEIDLEEITTEFINSYNWPGFLQKDRSFSGRLDGMSTQPFF